MSFGFGVGDFVTLSTLTLKLYKPFKNAPDEFSEVSRELHSFHIVVADLMGQAGGADSSLNRHATARRHELMALRDNLVATMEELADLHRRYQQMGRISWSRFQLGQEDLGAMRSKLVLQISAMNTFVSSLNMATLGRMEPMLERIFFLLDERAKGTLEEAETVLSVKVDDATDGASWARIEMNLRSEGIPQKYIRENKDRIMEVVCSVVELNHLGGIDDETILPGDSVSQIGEVPSQRPDDNPGPVQREGRYMPAKDRPKTKNRSFSSSYKEIRPSGPNIAKPGSSNGSYCRIEIGSKLCPRSNRKLEPN